MKVNLKFSILFQVILSKSLFSLLNDKMSKTSRVHNIIVVHVCPMNFFYVLLVPGPILRHLGDLRKINLLPGENTRFLAEWGQYGYLKDGP
jgi:hypothetical protein